MQPPGPSPSGPPSVLHVDDDEAFLDLVETFLAGEHGLTIHTATDVANGIEMLCDPETPIECIVSDYEMPDEDGLSFLRRVRQSHPDLPFVLYTGRGSETVAAEAIAAGVTEYIQKETGTAQYAVLANRIEKSVERYRADRDSARRLGALESAREGIGIIDTDGTFEYANPAYAALYQYDPDGLVGEGWRTLHPASEVERIEAEVLPTVHTHGGWCGKSVGLRADGSTFHESKSIQELPGGGIVVVVCDLDHQARQFAPVTATRRAED